jgi:hypothetical protein
MQKTFLLSKASIFNIKDMEKVDYSYDKESGLNMVVEDGIEKIAVLSQEFSPTHSKTMRAPGDDDPDDERCY